MFREQEKARNPAYNGEYDSTISLLENTSVLIRNFRHHSPYKDIEDERFDENEEVLKWLVDWEKKAKAAKEANDETGDKILCPTTVFDIKSMIIGFKEVCKIIFQKYPGLFVIAKKFNTDVVENIFCQVRSRNGQNDNPTLAAYGRYRMHAFWACRISIPFT